MAKQKGYFNENFSMLSDVIKVTVSAVLNQERKFRQNYG